MKSTIISLVLLILCLTTNLSAQGDGIHSLKIGEILEYYEGPIEKLRELEPPENTVVLSDNRVRINYLNRHISALKLKAGTDISDHLKSIYKDSIIKLYEELEVLQSAIIADNMNSIDALSVYLAQFKNKKQGQDEILDNIGERVEHLRGVLYDLSETFDSYDRIIEKQNELINEALDLDIEAYRNTLFLAPGVEAATNLEPYISLGLGYISNEKRFSYGGSLKASYSPTQGIINVGVSVILGFNFERIEK